MDVLSVGDLELCFLNPEDVESQLNIFLSELGIKSGNQDDSDVSKAIESHSDLIPSVYEGEGQSKTEWSIFTKSDVSIRHLCKYIC